MKLASVALPTVYLASDLGSSASKIFYRVHPAQAQPLWMGAEVAEGLSRVMLSGLGTGGRPQDNAWLEIGDDVVMVGESAKAVLEANSLSANKSEKAVYKLAAALGVVAELEKLPSRYRAVVWLALPLAEVPTRHSITTRLTELCQQGFTCRGRAQQVDVTLKCYPEGFGLYLRRKQQLDDLGQSINHRHTAIVMMGHRNLSTLAFEHGSLNLGGAASDGPGFWPNFEKAARSAGVTAPDYPALMRALSSGEPHQISPAKAGVVDFSEAMTSVQGLYSQAVMVYLRDNLVKRVVEQSVDVVVSGGASQIIQTQLDDFFADLHCTDRVIVVDGSDDRLTRVVNQLPEVSQNSTLARRMADGYGLFLGLLGSLTTVAV